jgi:hypothetical protein
MKTELSKVTMSFTMPVLGMSPNNPKIFTEFFAERASNSANADEEHVALVDKFKRQAVMAGMEIKTDEDLEAFITLQVNKQKTVFPQDENGLFMWDYQLRGFFKEQVGALINLGEITNLTNYAHRKAVDQFLLITQRRNYFTRDGKNILAADGEITRTLRVMTPQGERVSLACSETINPPANLEFTVQVFLPDKAQKKTMAVFDKDTLRACLEFGSVHGFGQWRSGGNGRFTFVLE